MIDFKNDEVSITLALDDLANVVAVLRNSGRFDTRYEAIAQRVEVQVQAWIAVQP